MKLGRQTILSWNIKAVRLLPFLFPLLDACVEPLAVDYPVLSPRFVVDALLTDQPGPYEVSLFYTTNAENTNVPTVETGATVFIVDEDGNSEPLFEEEAGKYRTSAASSFKGEVGKSYSLEIVKKNGRKYNSPLQEMMPSGEIENVNLEFVDDGFSGPPVFDGFRLRVDARGDINNTNLFRWRWTGTYKSKTFPELRTQNPGGGGPAYPAPLPCSGYVREGDGIRRVGECSCCICWVTELSSQAIVSDNRFVDDYFFQQVPVGLVPITSLRFYEKYHVEIEQLSLSPQVYEFWRLLGKQQASAGNIFQPNSIKIRGNVVCTTNPDEEVLGVFSVSALTRRTFFIYPEQVPAELPEMVMVPDACLATFPGSTDVQPIFW